MEKLQFGKVLFSRRGSYLAIDKSDDGLLIKNVSDGTCKIAYKIPFSKNAVYDISPRSLIVKDGGENEICLFGRYGLKIKCSGAPLIMEYSERKNVYNVNFIVGNGNEIKIGDTQSNGFTYFKTENGILSVDAPNNVGKESRKFLAKREYIKLSFSGRGTGNYFVLFELFPHGDGVPTYSDETFDESATEAEKDFESWSEDIIQGDERKTESAYIMWSNLLPADGYIKREAMVCSKAGMTRVWSWDNAFNALALSRYKPRLALDQFMIPYDFITASGQIPDAVSATTAEWTNVKPPVQGFVYTLMQKKNPYFSRIASLSEIYFPMKRNTDWWLNCRGEVPSYYHGNDSGADNATVFDAYDSISTPDMLALIAVQCKFLSDVAKRLGYLSDEKKYAAFADEFEKKAIDDYFDGRLFVRNGDSGEKYYSDSLVPLKIIILGEKLTHDIKRYVIERLKNDFIGRYGVASEALNSKEYATDGYWRGACWAPDQIIIADGLYKIGEKELADKILTGFGNAVAENGFFENYDPHTGKAQRCWHYCWPIAAFYEYLELSK